MKSGTRILAVLLLLSPCAEHLAAQAPASLFSEMRWRNIGPFRGGRTRSAAGVASQPFTFYAGATNGGVWKTTDAGRTWFPIFDATSTNSIGAVVVAPSDPNIVYVGSGEGLQRPDLSVGDGVYRSNDAGRTWTHLGLRDAQQIPNIAVDPTDPNRLFVAALGHPYGASAERGLYRSSDGGVTFTPVLQRDENTGANDVDIDPSNPMVIYANLWEARQGPWENGAFSGNNGGLFKSTDGGGTWRQLSGGLPPNVGQVNLAIAPSNTRRVYAAVAAGGAVGIYRSDDAGDSWTRITTDTRPAGRIGGGDLPVPIVNPKDADAVIMASTVSWKSTDGGKTWTSFKGAPGGEDYQGGLISPVNPDIVFLVADQGAVVSLNGGESWSSWYNQSSAQMYHVTADNAFPYRLCSGQQESGSACVASRGNYGVVSDRDWLPVGVDEYGYVAPDPLNPDIVFGGRSVTRFDRRTGQTSSVSAVQGGRGAGAGPASICNRQVRTQPVVFSAADPHALFFGNNCLFKTVDGGVTWKQISGDLARRSYELPKSIGKYTDPSLMTTRGVIYTIGPSPLDVNRIWVGTDDGLIYVSVNGGVTWKDVTPPQIGPFWKVFMIDASHFDGATAYAAVNTLRLDDQRPHFYRTHDLGGTWTEITDGMSTFGAANSIREDPVKQGLLFASTETGVYTSLDDGNHWTSLRLNLPASSARDIIVKDNDLAIGTHGRGFWILDDITPLRQISPATLATNVVLFKPAPAMRVRWNMSTDMPWPKEEPVGENPPDGAAINYYLKSATAGAVTLEIVTLSGRVVRRYSSTDSVAPIPEPAAAPVPLYWYRHPQRLGTSAGLHRFHWDVHYQSIATGGGGRGGLPINSVPGNATPALGTPWASPGNYTVRLTVDGKSYTQPITVKQDPRVTTPLPAMAEVYVTTNTLYFDAADAQQAVAHLISPRSQVAALLPRASGTVAAALKIFDEHTAAVQGATPVQPGGRLCGGGVAAAPGAGGGGGGVAPGTIPCAVSQLSGVVNTFQAADVAPTSNQRRAVASARAEAAPALAAWTALRTVELPSLNIKLKAAGLTPVTLQ
ncbi:MAG: glycoside hydrolase [Longimicrobiales bacterium]